MKENALINKRTRQAIAIISFLVFATIIVPYMFRLYVAPEYFKEILITVNIPWLWFFGSRELEKRGSAATKIDTTEISGEGYKKIDTTELVASYVDYTNPPVVEE